MARPNKTPKQLAAALAAGNPGVNEEKLLNRLKASRRLKRAGIVPAGYNLLPPFSRRTAQASGRPVKKRRRKVPAGA